MNIELKKFGTTLTSREGGKEAYTVMQASLKDLKEGEEVILDFSSIDTFAPSWGDEVLSNLYNTYKDRLVFTNISNQSVTVTLDMLSEINGFEFNLK